MQQHLISLSNIPYHTFGEMNRATDYSLAELCSPATIAFLVLINYSYTLMFTISRIKHGISQRRMRGKTGGCDVTRQSCTTKLLSQPYLFY